MYFWTKHDQMQGQIGQGVNEPLIWYLGQVDDVEVIGYQLPDWKNKVEFYRTNY